MVIIQTRLEKQKVKYSYGPYNKSNNSEQWIRITEGCPNQCPYCYEPKEQKIFPIPAIERNIVKIMDMNLISKREFFPIVESLPKKLNGKTIYYELICGIDYRYMNQTIANKLKECNFIKIRLAWDWEYKEQFRIKDTIDFLKYSGYNPSDIMVFILCNWRIPYEINIKKLDLCKVWNVKVCDCWYDNQTSPNINPIFWNEYQIRDFRRRARKHNQLVNFRIDPEVK